MDKSTSRLITAAARRFGIINAAPCEVCGSVKVHAHHDDYSFPLRIRWLCSFHHSRVHLRSSGINYPSMSADDERKFWVQALATLREKFTLEYLAEEIGVGVRQVSNWQSGDDRPKGMNAVRLYLFHEKHRTEGHGTVGPIAEIEKSA